MLAHGRDEMTALADRCAVDELPGTTGWSVELWEMGDDEVGMAVDVYAAVLAGGVSENDPVVALLAASGVDLLGLLEDGGASKDDITRSDVTELVAAASMLALDGADLDRMHMPNVPKMSRRKSDSGIDVFDITLDDLASPGDDLGAGDRLVVVSVKHSVDEASVGGLRWKLVDSLSGRELTRAYMAAQLRVLHGRLCQEGMTGDVAERVYLFLRDFPDPMLVKMVAVGVVDVAAEDAIRHHVALLSPVSGAEHVFRAVLLPGLDELHTRCP